MTKQKPTWKTISSKTLLTYRAFDVIEDQVITPNGEKSNYVYMKGRDAVTIIAQNKQCEVVLLKEFRYPNKKIYINLPAGNMEPGLSAEENAKKELLEEAGIKAEKIQKIGQFNPAPSSFKKDIHVFWVSEYSGELSNKNTEGDESISQVFSVTIPEIKSLIADGKIESGITLAALNLFFQKKPK